MSLKDQLVTDIDSVFLNLTEFADSVVIDGKTVNVVFDDDRITEAQDTAGLGLTIGDKLIFMKKADLSRMPNRGDQLTLNGRNWYVVTAIENYSMYEIRISRERVFD